MKQNIEWPELSTFNLNDPIFLPFTSYVLCMQNVDRGENIDSKDRKIMWTTNKLARKGKT